MLVYFSQFTLPSANVTVTSSAGNEPTCMYIASIESICLSVRQNEDVWVSFSHLTEVTLALFHVKVARLSLEESSRKASLQNTFDIP